MPDSPEHVPVIAVASGKGGVGKTTGAVPEQVAAYKLIADQITARLTSS
jgi:MinD-like ATPase involved in chromosome partitioning or flagellar assembly